MGWLSKRMPADRQVAPLKKANFGFDGAIKQEEWQWSTKRGTMITERAFVNPDPNSAVAAILVTVSDEGYVGLDLINRSGRFPETELKLEQAGGFPKVQFLGVSIDAARNLRRMGLDIETTPSQMVGHKGLLSEGRVSEVKSLSARAVKTLLETDILSSNPKVCEALVSAIGVKLKTFESIGATPAAIEGR
jgi:hypothetical protein